MDGRSSEAVTSDGPSKRRTPRKATRRELAFLRSLLAGERVVRDGPVGTCVRRGWCAPKLSTPAEPRAPKIVRYAITQAGLALLCATSRVMVRATPEPGPHAVAAPPPDGGRMSKIRGLDVEA